MSELKGRLQEMGVYGAGLYGLSYFGVWSASGFEAGWNETPAQVAGLVLVGFAASYAVIPVLRDLGQASKSWERKSKTSKVFLTATGQRTIPVGTNGNSVTMAPLVSAWRISKHKQMQSVPSSSAIVATRDIVFYHNSKSIPGTVYSHWLNTGYALQLQYQRDPQTKRKSGLSRASRGDAISQPYWRRLYDLLAYTVQWYSVNRGIVLAEDSNGGYVLRCKPGVVYDCTCAILA